MGIKRLPRAIFFYFFLMRILLKEQRFIWGELKQLYVYSYEFTLLSAVRMTTYFVIFIFLHVF